MIEIREENNLEKHIIIGITNNFTVKVFKPSVVMKSIETPLKNV